MIKFNEILMLFFMMVGLAFSGAPLSQLEKVTGKLAVESNKVGYMSLAKFNSALTRKDSRKSFKK